MPEQPHLNSATGDATVVALRPGRLTAEQYRAERDNLRATYGDSDIEAAAHRDQALAALFYRSGWTQAELAEAEGKSEGWVVQSLRLGRFLNFLTTVSFSETAPKNLTERKFRGYWERTGAKSSDERERFADVLGLMKADLEEGPQLHRSRAPLTKTARAVLATARDGKWHKLETIADRTMTDHTPPDPENWRAIASAIEQTGAWLLLIGDSPAARPAADDLFHAAQCLEQARRAAAEQPGGGNAPELLLAALASLTRAETMLRDIAAAQENEADNDANREDRDHEAHQAGHRTH